MTLDLLLLLARRASSCFASFWRHRRPQQATRVRHIGHKQHKRMVVSMSMSMVPPVTMVVEERVTIILHY